MYARYHLNIFHDRFLYHNNEIRYNFILSLYMEGKLRLWEHKEIARDHVDLDGRVGIQTQDQLTPKGHDQSMRVCSY